MAIQITLLRLGRIRYRQLMQVIEHRHSFFHLSYVLSGQGYVVLNGQLYEIGAGEMHYYHPSWTHEIWAQPHTRFEVLDLRFLVTDAAGFEMTKKLPAFIKAGVLLENIVEMMHNIELLGVRRETPLWYETAHAYLVIILSQLMQYGEQTQCHLARTPSSLVAEALKIMRDSLPFGISVGQLAERLFISPTHLTMLFKTQLGMTVHDVMIQMKMEHAKQDLAIDPKISITRISQVYGWKDARHFRRHFKKVTGMTPTDYARCFSDRRATNRVDENWLVFNRSVSDLQAFEG